MSLNLEYLPLFIFVWTLTYKKKKKKKNKTQPETFGVGEGTVRQPTCHTVAWGLGPAMLLHPGPRP